MAAFEFSQSVGVITKSCGIRSNDPLIRGEHVGARWDIRM
jgi:hypothetical protein